MTQCLEESVNYRIYTEAEEGSVTQFLTFGNENTRSSSRIAKENDRCDINNSLFFKTDQRNNRLANLKRI